MNVTVSRTPIEGVLIITPDVFRDERGFFMESYHRRVLQDQGVDLQFVQDNHSRSRRGVLRGLHYQNASAPQYRLVRCTVGEIFDVIVDLRVGSPTFGEHLGLRLSAENQWQVLMPPEVAHGFQVLSETAEVQYKVSGHHHPAAERSLAWNDPDLRLPWPITPPFVSARDKQAPSLASYLLEPDFFYRRDTYGLTA
jgi:dTDP-4-dehydrorhamnose 3,5-epimerase